MNDNLIPFNERTEDERREIARKGGIASGEARRERKAIRETLAERLGAADLEEVCDQLIERAKTSGRDFEILRDTLGEKPRDDIAIHNMDQSLERMEAWFAEAQLEYAQGQEEKAKALSENKSIDETTDWIDKSLEEMERFFDEPRK